jgi:tetratricopeptide (TPR) repeat protein
MVNYHAFGRWLKRRGGEFLHASHLHTSLNLTAGLLGGPPGGAVETRLAFEEWVERQGPDDFFDVKKSVELAYEEMSLEQLLAWIRFAGWDANILLGCYPQLMELLGPAPQSLLEEVRRTAMRVWEGHFPIRETRDLAFHLGVLLCEAGFYLDALALFHESMALYGSNASTFYNLGLCLFHLEDRQGALEALDQALADDPDFEAAAALRAEISSGEKEESDPSAC